MEKVVVLVLGKRLNKDGTASEMLLARLDTAAEVQSQNFLISS